MAYRLLFFGLLICFLTLYGCSYPAERIPFERNETVNMTFRMGDRFGMNADTTGIHFGVGKKGSSTNHRRDVHIVNRENISQLIVFTLSGELAPYVRVSENNFVLTPGEKKDIKVELDNIYKLSTGNYSGLFTATYREVIE